jgi:hypothetical protein
MLGRGRGDIGPRSLLVFGRPTHPHQKEDEGGFATPAEKLKNGEGGGGGWVGVG